MTKQNKELSQQVSTIGGERDKLQERLQEAIEQVDDLKEQVRYTMSFEPLPIPSEKRLRVLKFVATLNNGNTVYKIDN